MKVFLTLLTFCSISAFAAGSSQLVTAQKTFREHGFLISIDGQNPASGPVTVSVKIVGKVKVGCNTASVQMDLQPVGAGDHQFLVNVNETAADDFLTMICAHGRDLEYSAVVDADAQGAVFSVIAPEGATVTIEKVIPRPGR